MFKGDALKVFQSQEIINFLYEDKQKADEKV